MSDGWVCPICGLDYDTIAPSDALVALRSYPRRYLEVLRPLADTPEGDRRLRARPAPSTWSAIEYTAHLADVLRELNSAVVTMLRQDRPTITSDFDPDLAAEERGYAARSSEQVLQDLESAAAETVDTVADISAEDWGRTATFSFGDRDVLAIIRNAVHEGSHHLRDVREGLAAIR